MTYLPRMNGRLSMYARPSPRLGVLSTRAPAARATAGVSSVELSTMRISADTPARRNPSWHQATNVGTVSSSFSAGTTIENSGFSTSPTGTRSSSSGSTLGDIPETRASAALMGPIVADPDAERKSGAAQPRAAANRGQIELLSGSNLFPPVVNVVDLDFDELGAPPLA